LGSEGFCREGERSVSLLPSFAQNYRVLNSDLLGKLLSERAVALPSTVGIGRGGAADWVTVLEDNYP